MSEAAAWFIVLNPVSGGGRARRHWPRLARALARHGVRHEFASSTGPGDTRELARKAVLAGHRRLLTLGGDGSFHELVNGLLAQDLVPASALIAAVAPLGTGNDWAAAMQVPHDAERLAAAMSACRSRRVDLGRAGFTGSDGDRHSAWFHNVAGAGLDAQVLSRTPLRGPRSLAYLVGLARTVRGFQAPQLMIEADGHGRRERCFLAIAAIGPRCGGGMLLAPSASPDDGLLHLVTIRAMPLRQVLWRLPMLYNGTLPRDPAATTDRCRRAGIVAEPPVAVQADGQLLGHTPLTLEVHPGALNVLDCRLRDNQRRD